MLLNRLCEQSSYKHMKIIFCDRSIITLSCVIQNWKLHGELDKEMFECCLQQWTGFHFEA